MTSARCRHCGQAHPRGTNVCPTTRLPLTLGRSIPAAPQLPRPVVQQKVPSSLVGRVVGDRYGVSGLIGSGAMGTVYEAEHLAIGRPVAVKVLHERYAHDKAAASRLEHETRVAGTIGHPNICAIYDMGRLEDGSPYIVMERLQGETLAQRIKRKGALKVSEVVEIGLQILSAVVAAHQKGVIHRDLKPENIFLSHRPGMRPMPKLLDFGIAKAASLDDSVSDIKGMNAPSIAPPYYMAPEQARGERKLDHRVDIWAAGAVLYEMLSGRRPFIARNYNALLVEILSAVQPPLRELRPGLHPSFDAIVARALAKSKHDRFASAEAFLEALRVFKRDEQPPSIRQPIATEDTSGDNDETTVYRRGGGTIVQAMPSPATRRSPQVGRAPSSTRPPPAARSQPGSKSAPSAKPAATAKPAAASKPAPAPKVPRPSLPRLYEDDESTIVDPPRFPFDPSFSDTSTTLRHDGKRRR
jgi:serine/threonine protein kinase